MQKRILITGSNGLLGQKLISALKSKYHLLATSTGHCILSQKSGFEYQTLDITRAQEVVQVFDNFKPHVVVNAAAMTDVDGCETNRNLCHKVNVDAVSVLAQACKKHQTHFIQISTDFIFDGENGPYVESDIPNPLCYYGLSKLKSEQILQKSDCKWAILRTIILYGTAENLKRNNIVLWARKALKEGQPLHIIDDQFRSPTLAEDLAQACLLVIEKEATGIYHTSGKDIMSIYEMINRMADFYKCPKTFINRISSKTLNQKAIRPPKTGFIIEKSMRELNYQPHTFEEGLQILEQQLNQQTNL